MDPTNLSPIVWSPSCSYSKLMGSRGHGPKLNPWYIFKFSPLAVGEGASGRMLVGYFVSSSFPLLGVTLVFLHPWAVCFAGKSGRSG